MLSRSPEIMRSISLSAIFSVVGLTMRSPSTRPTRNAAIGPAKGMSDSNSDADAPTMPRMSASFSPSEESTVTKPWTS